MYLSCYKVIDKATSNMSQNIEIGKINCLLWLEVKL